MSLDEAIREVVADAIREIAAEVIAEMRANPKPFWTIDEVRAHLGVARREVDKMLADGRLWKLEGLDTTRVLIPAKAVEQLQERPRSADVIDIGRTA